VFIDGGLDAQTFRLEGNIGSRTVGGSGIINRYAASECIGVCIAEPFSAQSSSVKAFFRTPGAAVLACELAGLSWSAINLARLKATHHRQRQRQDSQRVRAAAKASWSVNLKEDEAVRAERMRSMAASLGSGLCSAVYDSVRAGIRLLNNSTSRSPVIPTAAIMAKAINPAMRLYSIAVAPSSSRRNFRSIHSLPCLDKNDVARAGCYYNKQNRKIVALAAPGRMN
jgi:hypothetical protein